MNVQNKKHEAVGVFIPLRKMGGVEYVVLMPDVLPLRDGQSVKIVLGQRQTQPSP